jgi:hypothetical protein
MFRSKNIVFKSFKLQTSSDALNFVLMMIILVGSIFSSSDYEMTFCIRNRSLMADSAAQRALGRRSFF